MFDGNHENRRDFLKCMAWAGTGALFSFSGGIGGSIGLDSALAAPIHPAAAKSFSFVQLSDSHIGFNKPPNSDARATFREAIAKVKALPTGPISSSTPATCRSSRATTSSTTPTRC